MIDSPSLLLAFAAGFVSFVSPCVLPLVPGYLAAIAGTSAPPAVERRVDPRLLARAGVFVLTFSAIFIVLGLSATALGDFLFSHKTTLNKVAGVAIVLMGVFFIASVWIVRLNREYRPHGLIERAGRGGPIVAGAAFALAWTPCVGPTLGAILGLAATRDGTGRGALLLSVYSLGLALPFLVSAVALNAAQRAFGFFKRHYVAIQVTAGVVLVAMGVLMWSGEFFRLNAEVQKGLSGLGINVFESI